MSDWCAPCSNTFVGATVPLQLASSIRYVNWMMRSLDLRIQMFVLLIWLLVCCVAPFETPPCCDTLRAQIHDGVEKLDGDLLKPYFVALGIMVAMNDHDDLRQQRIDFSLKKLFELMRDLRQYADATYVSIACVLKLAATQQRIRDWMMQEEWQGLWAWIEKWLRSKVKQMSVSAYSTGYTGYSTQQSPNLKRAQELLQHVNDLLDGHPLQLRLYDASDDPHALVGRSVVFFDALGRPKRQVAIVNFDAASNMHTATLETEDGNNQSYEYNMHTERFLFSEQYEGYRDDDSDDDESDDDVDPEGTL